MPILVSPCPNCYNESPANRRYNPLTLQGSTAEEWHCLKCNTKWHRDDTESKILWNLVKLREAFGAVPASTKPKKGQ